MTRKEFLRLAAAPAALAAIPTAGITLTASADTTGTDSKSLNLSAGPFSLALTVGQGLQCRLVHLPTNTLLADGPYSYSLAPITFTVASQDPSTITLQGDTGTGLRIEHRFTLAPGWLEESIKLTNTGSHPQITTLRCGFTLPVQGDTLKNYIFTAVPYRREPSGDRAQYADYTLDQILHERRRSHLREHPEIRNEVGRFAQPRVFTEDYLSEGWAFTDGKNGFLVTKYNQTARDFTILDRVPSAGDRLALRWGGAGAFDDAEGACHLAPGATRDFGVTRLTPFQGNLVQGYYAFRAEMDSRGHIFPADYDPPSHWNELYDNKLWWTGSHAVPENRKKYYSLPDLKFAAANAQHMGCEALYLDPGWDTPQSSKIWGAERLGSLADFIAMLKTEYGGLKLSLHAPLSGWTGKGNPTDETIPGSAIIQGPGAGPSPFACGACERYIQETAKRLKVLADAGVSFFMFDGTVWMGECFARDHGHSYPSTAAEHVEGMNRIARLAHANNPGVLIEMHDQMLSGIALRYVPSYYGQGRNAAGELGWNEIWAFELMWSPMGDLVGGHSIALYYFNLAYSIPAYIHIDLRSDNANCLMLWWNISTCRHLGVGGTHPDPAIRENQRQTIATYRRLKPFFTTGAFYGIDEQTHVHIDRKKTGAVINCFNLTNSHITREIHFDPSLYALPADHPYSFTGAPFVKSGPHWTAQVKIPAFGHTLIEIK